MAGQNSGPKRYDFLEGLSMNELEELLRKSAELGQDDEDAFVDAITEVIMRKEKENPTGCLPDVDDAWREFQTHFNTPEGQGLSLYPDEADDEIGQAAPPKPKKKRKVFTLRRFAVAAVIAALYFATILPTALGYENVFIMVGSWCSLGKKQISRKRHRKIITNRSKTRWIKMGCRFLLRPKSPASLTL